MAFRILGFLLAIAFASALATVALALVRTRSLAAEMKAFEAHPANGSLTQKFFYGWAIPWQLPFQKLLLKAFGDTFMTWLWRMMGALFLVLAIGFVVMGLMSLFLELPSIN